MNESMTEVATTTFVAPARPARGVSSDVGRDNLFSLGNAPEKGA
jgi:hypothetical protein